MAADAWRVLTTLPDLPSAQVLVDVLRACGVGVRVRSDAAVLGLAAPTRLYVEAADEARARALLAAREFSEAELAELSLSADPGVPER
ncbi:MAG TPA: hypothetical protein VMG33_09630 [Steroidobacteraceae bacterium]|nr:hypothetical protein [Steroidobacteraceae bacterium]